MGIDEIKKAILTEAEQKARNIIEDAKTQAGVITQEYERQLADECREIINRTKLKAAQKIQQAQFKLQAAGQSEILTAKKKILDTTFRKAADVLAKMDDQHYVAFMVKLIEQLPPAKGELMPAKGKEALLKKAVMQSGRDLKISSQTVEDTGGFVFLSSTMEIDQTFTTLVRAARERHEVAMAALLFNQEKE